MGEKGRGGAKERAAGGNSKMAGSRRNKERFFAKLTATATRKPKKQ